MEKTTKKATKKAPVKKVTEPIKEELPTIVTMGMYRDSTGWRYVELTTQGDKVIKREEADHGTRKAFVIDEIKINMVKRFFRDGGE